MEFIDTDDVRDEQIGYILNAYLDSWFRGEPISEPILLAMYPQYARDLREHLWILRILVSTGMIHRQGIHVEHLHGPSK
mgnify:CR=1 FL=1